jgi:hypothetical protein
MNTNGNDYHDEEITLADCIDNDGQLDPAKYSLLLAREELELAENDRLHESFRKRSTEEMAVAKPAKRARIRTSQTLRPYYFDENGQMVFLRPQQTFWYLSYVQNPPTDDERWQRKFRRRFRLPHSEFLKMLEHLEAIPKFARWYRKDAIGNAPSPIELLLLGTFCYLPCGLTFDDLEEYTAINEETHRQFFHVFIEYGSTVLFDEFVKYPTTADEYRQHQPEFRDGGLHGAGFSTDATNVLMSRCSHNLK